MISKNVTVAADGSVSRVQTGSFTYIVFSQISNPVQVSFDGTTWLNISLNDKLGPLAPAPSQIYFRSVSGLAINVSFNYDTQPFVSQSTSQKVASTYVKCTYFPSGTLPGGTYVAPPGNSIVIPSGDNGHQRKTIMFGVSTVGMTLVVCDQNNNPGLSIGALLVPTPIESDGIFRIYSGAAAADCFITEIYYNQ